MHHRSTFHVVDHRCNPNIPGLASVAQTFEQTSQLPTNQYRSVPQFSSNASSFQYQINQILQEWRQLQNEKKRCQQQQQPVQLPRSTEHHARSDFDRIMEEDLENQLKELERQEEEQCERLKQTLDQQLHQHDQSDVTDEFERECLEQLELFEDEQRQQQTYDVELNELEGWACSADVPPSKPPSLYPLLQPPEQINSFTDEKWLSPTQYYKNIYSDAWNPNKNMQFPSPAFKIHRKKPQKIIGLLRGFWSARKCTARTRL